RAHQELKDGELLSCELQIATAAIGFSSERIKAQILKFQYWLDHCSRTPGKGAKAHDQLFKCKRFSEIVIRAQREPFHLICQGRSRRQHEYPHSREVFSDDSAHLITVCAGNVAIEDHDVVVIDRDTLQRLVPI